jgi:DNA modification methylase
MLNLGRRYYSKVSFNTNTLFYGDNLEILRHLIPGESIDLIYLDPPFNSKADYNVLFKEASGEQSTAQIQAFSDFWHWDVQARRAYEYLTVTAPNESLANFIQTMFNFLGKNDMLAYLVMMGIRLLELNRVLKPTGSIFLHCDMTASHYLKLLLDSIFGVKNFVNEIIWKRQFAHSDSKQGSKHFGRIHDSILFYAKDIRERHRKWNQQYTPYSQEYIDRFFFRTDENGRKYWLADTTGPGGASKGNPRYEFLGVTRYWRFSRENMERLYKEGRIIQTKPGNVPVYKRYLDEMPGIPFQDIWLNVRHLTGPSRERLGYPTQKPLELLERIIKSCSNEGDWILDPFCGCGTAVIAAEKLHRHWIGIDITWLAINLVKGRLNDMFPGIQFKTEGEPRDMGAAKDLANYDRYQFQWWVLSLIGARPVGSTPAKPKEGKRGADEGVDGWLRFADGPEGHVEKIVVQVKSGDIGVRHIRELRDVIARQRATIGIFLTLEEPTSEMIREAKATDPYVSPTWNHEYSKIQIMTIRELLTGKRPDIPPTMSAFIEAPLAKRSAGHRQETLFT